MTYLVGTQCMLNVSISPGAENVTHLFLEFKSLTSWLALKRSTIIVEWMPRQRICWWQCPWLSNKLRKELSSQCHFQRWRPWKPFLGNRAEQRQGYRLLWLLWILARSSAMARMWVYKTQRLGGSWCLCSGPKHCCSWWESWCSVTVTRMGKFLGSMAFFFFVFANLSQANLDWGYSVVEMFMHTESVSPQALLILPIPSEAFCQPVCLVER